MTDEVREDDGLLDSTLKHGVAPQTVRAAAGAFTEYLARLRARGHRVRVLERPYARGVNNVRAVLEIDGRMARRFFSARGGRWRAA